MRRRRRLTISSPSRPTLLLIAPSGSYRTLSYLRSAKALNMAVLVVSDSAHSIIGEVAQGVSVDFSATESAFNIILTACSAHTISCVLATDDKCVELASLVANHLKLAHNSAHAAVLTQRKDLARKALQTSDCLTPGFQLFSLKSPVDQVEIQFPVVVKPLGLSGSRGVIRANDLLELETALQRVSKILATSGKHGDEADQVLLEEYIEGKEYAVEGFIINRHFHLLTIFDKPEPLQGPFFEESYYISPSRLPTDDQQQISMVLSRCCEAYGLQQGPVHAEIRVNPGGIYLIELASRTIGGQCGKMIESILGVSLEELVLLGMTGNLPDLQRSDDSVGVLMIPIPEAGLLKRVEGLTDAMATDYIEDLEIHINPGYEMVPLPEGASYLGFIFARSPDFDSTWQALKTAHDKLRFVTQPRWGLERQPAPG